MLYVNEGFNEHPLVLLSDPMKNLISGFTYFAKLTARFPKFQPTMAWKLALAAYFTEPTRIINVSLKMQNTLEDQKNFPAALERELRKEFGSGAQYLVCMVNKFSELRDSYLKQELALLS
jgi:hypothetical protein